MGFSGNSNDFSILVEKIKLHGLYPDINIIDGISTTPEVIINGEKHLMFSSNNYLGLAYHPAVKKSASIALEKYGLGSGGSRLLSGNLDIHNKLEKEIADFKSVEDAITFLAGYMANVGVIPALLNRFNFSNSLNFINKVAGNNPVVISDEYNHASIIDGCRLATSDKVIYKHNDPKDLEKKISKIKSRNILIVTDGVFSMDGDIAPLPDLVNIANEYKALLMVDDAHASGVLGKNGRGTADHFGVEGKVDITMGTFTKSFGGVGGFVAANKDIIEYLRITARTYIFSAPIPPAVSAGLIEAIHIAKEDTTRRERLWENTNYLREGLKRIGYRILGETPIVPVVIGKEEIAIAFSRELLKNNIFAPCVRWPAVPEGDSRLRLTVMADHRKEELDRFLNVMGHLKQKLMLTNFIH